MRGTVRRITAFCTAALLCLSGWGCAFGKIRIEPLTPEPPVTVPPETEPPAPETDAPETSAPETGAPEPDGPGTAEEPSPWVQFAEEDFRERRGTGWVIKALSFRPETLCSLGEGLIFAAGSSKDPSGEDPSGADPSGADPSGADPSGADMSSMKCAVLDLNAMAVSEGEIDLNESEGGPEYLDMSCFCLNGDPYLILGYGQEVLRLDPDRLTVTGRASWPGVRQYEALPLPDGRAVMDSANQGRLLFITPADPEDGGVRVTESEISMPEGFTDFWISGATTDGMLSAVFNNEADPIANEDEWRQIYGLIDSRTGEVSVLGITEGVGMQAVGNYLMESDYASGKYTVHKPGAELGKIRLTPPEDSWILRPEWGGDDDLIFFEHAEDEVTVVKVMDLDTLRAVGQFRAEMENPWDFYSFSGKSGDWIVGKLYENEGSEPRLFCWNWEDIEDPAPAGYYPTLSRSEEAEIRNEIRRIYKETGVSVYVGNDAVRYLYGYAVQVVTDPGKQLEGLRSLAAFFDNCPPGYIRELTENSSSIDICLTGKIIPEPGNRDSISDAAAFVTPMDGCQVMVLDVMQGGLAQTVAHEFLHIAENAMWNIFNAWWEEHPDWYEEGEQNPTDVFWYWPALNPEGFEYSMVYTDEDGVTLGSDDPHVWNEEAADIDGIYFVDGYSTTYPTEDRARIFENLATCAPDALPEYFGSEALRKKAAYLCACLKRSFRSLAEAEDVFWERSLNPEWTYEYFEANYTIEAQG